MNNREDMTYLWWSWGFCFSLQMKLLALCCRAYPQHETSDWGVLYQGSSLHPRKHKLIIILEWNYLYSRKSARQASLPLLGLKSSLVLQEYSLYVFYQTRVAWEGVRWLDYLWTEVQRGQLVVWLIWSQNVTALGAVVLCLLNCIE